MTTIHPFTIDNTGILYYNNKDLKLLNPYFFTVFNQIQSILYKERIYQTRIMYSRVMQKQKGFELFLLSTRNSMIFKLNSI